MVHKWSQLLAQFPKATPILQRLGSPDIGCLKNHNKKIIYTIACGHLADSYPNQLDRH